MRILESIHNLDLLTFDWCLQRKRRAIAVKWARWISRTADGPLYVLFGVCALISQNTRLVELMLWAFAIERACYFVFKSLFKRNRPTAAIPGYRSIIEPSDQFSFPSGHTSAAFLMSTIIVSQYPFVGWFLYPWAASVGASRVILGVHFPTDVLAGALMGFGLCTITIAALH